MVAGNIIIQKAEFLPLYIKAREQANNASNIISALRTCEIVPLNSRIILVVSRKSVVNSSSNLEINNIERTVVNYSPWPNQSPPGLLIMIPNIVGPS